MLFKPFPGTRKEVDLLTGIAPVFRIDLESRTAVLVGTGFWVTSVGHLVTAFGNFGLHPGLRTLVLTFANPRYVGVYEGKT